MILTCPNCETRFQLSEELLGESGAKVKCSDCQEIWFQEPELEEPQDQTANTEQDDNIDEAMSEEDESPDNIAVEDIVEETLEEIQDIIKEHEEGLEGEKEEFKEIPDSVKPSEDEDFSAAIEKASKVVEGHRSKSKGDANGEGVVKGGALYGGIAAVALFLLSIGVLYTQAKSISNTFPASIPLYQAIGVELDIPGQGLIFDRVIADAQKEHLNIKGHIINLTGNVQRVPNIEASLKTSEGALVEKWMIVPEKTLLKAEETIPLEARQPFSGEAADMLHMRFVLSAVKEEMAHDSGEVHEESAESHDLNDAHDQNSSGSHHKDSSGHNPHDADHH